MRTIKLLPRIFISLILCAIFFASTVSLNAAEEWAFIDLKPYANAKIVDTQWWTGNPGSSDLEELLEIAEDGHEFEGPGGEPVQFKVEDANLRIYGTNAAANPKQIEGIKVEMKAKFVYFLHMTGWEAAGAPSYKFVMNYDDKSSEELLMESHINSDDWCHIPAQLPDDNSEQIWTEPGVTCGTVSVIATKWENPHPSKQIKTIDFVSLETAAVPGLFAIQRRSNAKSNGTFRHAAIILSVSVILVARGLSHRIPRTPDLTANSICSACRVWRVAIHTRSGFISSSIRE